VRAVLGEYLPEIMIKPTGHGLEKALVNKKQLKNRRKRKLKEEETESLVRKLVP